MPTKANSKNRQLRIVFMGTPDFAVASLDALYQAGHDIVGVITAPDRPAGRGRKIQFSAVKKYALEKGLNLLQPTNLKDDGFLGDLKDLDANVQVVVAFRMLPKMVWQMPEYGTFNLHASLLPNYRGAAPINWAIINGEKETGVTTFFIDEKIDTGQIILQDKVKIGEEESAGELHNKLMVMGADLVLKTINLIVADKVEPSSQKEIDGISLAPKIHRETCKIDWHQDLDSIYDLIRGLSPYPTAWTTICNDESEQLLKVYEAQKQCEQHDYQIGKVISNKKTLKIAVKNGFILLRKVQLQGKKAMTVQELLNGLQLSKKAYMR